MLKQTLKHRKTSCIEPEDAAHVVGLEHGVRELAEKMNIRPAVLANKLNPDNETNFLYLRDAVFLTELTDDNRILEAWCAKRGGVFVPLPEEVACDEDLSDQLLGLTSQLGSALAQVKDARADGVITTDEYDRIRVELRKTVNEVLKLDAVVSTQVRSITREPRVSGA
jgi:hypothetical protein